MQQIVKTTQHLEKTINISSMHAQSNATIFFNLVDGEVQMGIQDVGFLPTRDEVSLATPSCGDITGFKTVVCVLLSGSLKC